MEENEKIAPEGAAEEGASECEVEEKDAPAGEGEIPSSGIGREIALGLREIIVEEIERRLAPRDSRSDEEAALRALAQDPRFLRLLSERLAREEASARTPDARRRSSTALPASARQTPKNLDDARAAARRYFKID